MNRRIFIKTASASGLSIASGALLSANERTVADIPFGKVEHVIQIWLGGGASQIDTWDPKKLGDAKSRKAGSYYPAIDTNMPGVQVCEHLKHCAGMMDKITALRTVNHDVIDEHAAATNRMHTGRNVSGTIVYPSIGSCVAHEKGAAAEGVPAYVVIGYPNIARGPGFLGAESGFLYLLDTAAGPAGLKRPDIISDTRQARRERLLKEMRKSASENRKGKKIADYDTTVEASLKLTGPEFMSVFDLKSEKGDLRSQYGGEFGQRCLLARRLIQRGTRFIEVSHNMNFVNGTGWDTHNEGQLNQHILIQELDRAMSTLITDLENHQLLDKTLIVVNTEFGRPASFDGRGGRGHQGTAFSVVLAGGGLKHTGAYGETDDLSKTVLENPVTVPDLFATVHASMGIDPAKELYDGDRPIPITDRGKPIHALLA